MILDTLTQFSDSGDFAQDTGTTNVGSQIDLGSAGVFLSNGGKNPYLVVNVETAADGGGTATGTTAFQLASDSTASIAVNGDQTIHFTSKAYTPAELTAGTKLFFPLPVTNEYERFLGLQVVQAGEEEDDLVCSASITLDPSLNVAYPDGDN